MAKHDFNSSRHGFSQNFTKATGLERAMGGRVTINITTGGKTEDITNGSTKNIEDEMMLIRFLYKKIRPKCCTLTMMQLKSMRYC